MIIHAIKRNPEFMRMVAEALSEPKPDEDDDKVPDDAPKEGDE